MRAPMILPVLLLLGWSVPAAAQGNLFEKGRSLLGSPSSGSGGSAAAGLSESRADSGLREALRVATSRTVSQVGRTDGYYGDPKIRIPLPGFLETARKAMAAMGMSQTLDDLELRMNRAAEAAAPRAADIFGDAVAAMTVTDAKGIVTGPKDSATRYFKRTTTQPLTEAFRPIVDSALADVGAVQTYNAAVQNLGNSATGGLGGSLGGGLGNMLGGGVGGGAAGFNFTDFVVGQALDGIFLYIAEQEAAIRTNPAARTTELLRDVFGR